MNFFVTIWCVTFMGLPIASLISKENDIKVIVDVLQSFHKPSNVIANLCWKSSTIKYLVTTLAELENPKSVKVVDEVKDKDLVSGGKNMFLVDVACKGVGEFLDKAQSRKYFARPYRWFVMNRPNTKKKVPSELDEIDILPDSEVYVAQSKNSSYNINLIYKINRNCDWIIEEYASWSTGSGLNMSSRVKENVIAIRRRNFQREPVVTSMVVSDNNTIADLELMKYKEVDPVSKSGYNQMTPLYEFINATRRLILTNTWGYNVNGSWTGIMSHLSQGKADLPGSVMILTNERMQILDYLSFPTPSSIKFIFREPPLSYQNNLYLLPFKSSVWYCIGSFVVVLIIAMYVNAYWEARKTAADEKKQDGSMVLIPKVSDVTVFVMSAISQQGSTVELRGTLGRFVIFILFLVFVFLYTAYSASIVVLLQSNSNQIRTLADLLNSKLELGAEDTPYNRHFFMTARDPIRKAIYEKKIAPSGSKPKFFNLVDGILQLQKKPFAFNSNLGSAYKVIEKYFYEHEKCGLQEIAFIQGNYPWMACRRGSPYREIFKLGLLRNAEHGLNDRVNRIMFSKKPVCTVRGGSFVSVSLVDCYPILLLLLYGMILGVLLLLAEVLHHRRCQLFSR
uniref:Putative ionotropic receptor IR75q.1 n=1 Tax=Hedya nubiferana TaxID=572853 RepID=A0A223HCY5_9NEOP|nr:putative ionotropic receptor IR75q.1 [Hedya nubiferana]